MKSSAVVLGTCLIMAGVAVSSASGVKKAPSEKNSDTTVSEVLFRHVVSAECQTILCLLAIKGEPASDELMRLLEPLGRVSAPTPDDFIWEDGAVRGFSERHGQIVDMRSVVKPAARSAIVEVAFLTTGLGSSTCKYRLQRVSGEWVVDDEKTTCTL